MWIVGAHNSVNALYAVVDIHERTGLLPISPNLDFAPIRSQGRLATDSCRSFLFTSFVGTQGSVDVVETNHSSLEAVVFIVVSAKLFHKELFGAICLFGVSRVRILFLQIRNLRTLLKVLRVDTGRGGEEESLKGIDPCSF